MISKERLFINNHLSHIVHNFILCFRHGLSESNVLPNSVLFVGTVPPNSVLFGRTVPQNSVLSGGTVPPIASPKICLNSKFVLTYSFYWTYKHFRPEILLNKNLFGQKLIYFELIRTHNFVWTISYSLG